MKLILWVIASILLTGKMNEGEEKKQHLSHIGRVILTAVYSQASSKFSLRKAGHGEGLEL